VSLDTLAAWRVIITRSHQPRGDVAQALPYTLARLLAAREPEELAQAWSAFVSEYSRLILHVARSFGGTHDDVMDRYAFALGELRADDLRRLRGYVDIERGRFTTWLVVVVRRLCTDHARRRFGRTDAAATDVRRLRARLALLAGASEVDEVLPDPSPLPDNALELNEERRVLGAAMADLDPADRLLLKLRFRDDVAVSDIARRLGFPTVFHVYRRVNRVLARLRGSLQRAGFDDSAF
jgi:RNA polymerase sigma factor (sigma-70 family)